LSTPEQAYYLKTMGIDVWVPRARAITESVSITDTQIETPQADISTPAPAQQTPNIDWPALEQQVQACTQCALHETRTNVVFGVGNKQADIMFIGEAPGADEDQQGEPFVGKAGQLLNAMLQSVGLKREQVYIANILKCRPPNNRDPKPEEAASCTPYLIQQIQLLQPKLIVALGRIAAQRLLQTDASLSKLRGQLHKLPQTSTPMLVTYHPAYLLRSPQEKRKAWQDLLFMQASVRGQHS